MAILPKVSTVFRNIFFRKRPHFLTHGFKCLNGQIVDIFKSNLKSTRLLLLAFLKKKLLSFLIRSLIKSGFFANHIFWKKEDRCPQKIAKLCRIFEQNSILYTIQGLVKRTHFSNVLWATQYIPLPYWEPPFCKIAIFHRSVTYGKKRFEFTQPLSQYNPFCWKVMPF